jgi:hypothetical protein
MKLVSPIPEPVPLEEVAMVLAEAATRIAGGPPAMIAASGAQLAVALERAGFRVVRDPVVGAQFTL